MHQNALISQNATSQTGNLTFLNGLNTAPPSLPTNIPQNTTSQTTSPTTPQPTSGLNAKPTGIPNQVGMSDVLTVTVTRANSTAISISSLPANPNGPKNVTSSFSNQVPMSDSVLAMLHTLYGYLIGVSITNQVPLSDSSLIGNYKLKWHQNHTCLLKPSNHI